MAEIPNVCLRLSNRPENVLVVRQALTGVADSLALDAIDANDLNTAVTEACNNVVLHAYGGGEGPLELDVYALAGAIEVIVRDRGSGIVRRDDPEGREAAHDGIGLPVIKALSHRSRFVYVPGGGTEVRMEFATPQATALRVPPAQATALRVRPDGQVDDSAGWAPRVSSEAIELRLAPNALARAVLPRVLSTLAARAYFSTDRISDVQLVADALAANADGSINGNHLDVGVTVAQRYLELRIGPLRSGQGESLVAVAADGLAPVVERLTETKRVAREETGETLELRFVDQR